MAHAHTIHKSRAKWLQLDSNKRVEFHTHDRDQEPHDHNRENGKTYFKNELKEGVPVKCEGHRTLDMGINDDWVYAE